MSLRAVKSRAYLAFCATYCQFLEWAASIHSVLWEMWGRGAGLRSIRLAAASPGRLKFYDFEFSARGTALYIMQLGDYRGIPPDLAVRSPAILLELRVELYFFATLGVRQ